MNFKRLLRRFLRLIVLTKRRFDERVVNRGRHDLQVVAYSGFRITNAVIPILGSILFGLMIYDVGFNQFYEVPSAIFVAIKRVFLFLLIFVVLRFVFEWAERIKWIGHLYSLFFVLITYYLYKLSGDVISMSPLAKNEFLFHKLGLFGGIIFIFLSEVSHVLRFIYKRSVNPSFVFVASFAMFIVIGALLLMLPNATVKGITPVDAFFTSASAVCVTGLIVVDTAAHFTLMGKLILMMLIQIGGLGFMTFSGLLGYLAAGSVSFQNQLVLKDMLYSQRINNVIQMVFRIIIVTFFFEFIGVLFILTTIKGELFDSNLQRIFFAVFHSISAFCHAGFSTYTDGLYDKAIRFNYSFQLIIASLVILGGLGFPIVFNIFTFIRIKVQNFFRRLLRNPYQENFTRVLQITSRLALGTTIILLGIGFVAFFYFEQDATLTAHPTLWGKMVTSFFGSVTPRSSGFHTFDMSSLTLPTIMIILLLMWIGASPGSTGGGIKTTTAAVAFLNMVSIIRGKDRTEFHKTQITEQSINKAFAIILLSLLVIGISVFLISLNDGKMGLLLIAFESFSAFSTVGLSLGITGDLSPMSKVVLTFVMFIGRVGALTVIVAFVTQSKQLYYRYPSEDIIY